ILNVLFPSPWAAFRFSNLTSISTPLCFVNTFFLLGEKFFSFPLPCGLLFLDSLTILPTLHTFVKGVLNVFCFPQGGYYCIQFSSHPPVDDCLAK
ncbi:MAG: hypothetical protein RR472_04515, partial [Anaerovoracaceae bacterium]